MDGASSAETLPGNTISFQYFRRTHRIAEAVSSSISVKQQWVSSAFGIQTRKKSNGFPDAKIAGAEHNARTLTKETQFAQIPAKGSCMMRLTPRAERSRSVDDLTSLGPSMFKVSFAVAILSRISCG